MKYALIRRITYNRVVLWALDDKYNYVEVRHGYINDRTFTITIYKDHKKIDMIADVLLVPLHKVKNLQDSQIKALVKDKLITPSEAERMAVGT